MFGTILFASVTKAKLKTLLQILESNYIDLYNNQTHTLFNHTKISFPLIHFRDTTLINSHCYHKFHLIILLIYLTIRVYCIFAGYKRAQYGLLIRIKSTIFGYGIYYTQACHNRRPQDPLSPKSYSCPLKDGSTCSR